MKVLDCPDLMVQSLNTSSLFIKCRVYALVVDVHSATLQIMSTHSLLTHTFAEQQLFQRKLVTKSQRRTKRSCIRGRFPSIGYLSSTSQSNHPTSSQVLMSGRLVHIHQLKNTLTVQIQELSIFSNCMMKSKLCHEHDRT
jgi:hypothetical protein